MLSKEEQLEDANKLAGTIVDLAKQLGGESASVTINHIDDGKDDIIISFQPPTDKDIQESLEDIRKLLGSDVSIEDIRKMLQQPIVLKRNNV